jgi:hypothetical protein
MGDLVQNPIFYDTSMEDSTPFSEWDLNLVNAEWSTQASQSSSSRIAPATSSLDSFMLYTGDSWGYSTPPDDMDIFGTFESPSSVTELENTNQIREEMNHFNTPLALDDSTTGISTGISFSGLASFNPTPAIQAPEGSFLAFSDAPTPVDYPCPNCTLILYSHDCLK